MCGITGVFNFYGEKVSQGVVKEMTDALSHRGPDAEGLYIEENLGFGHRRLSILDTSDNGKQPMKSGAGNWIVIFNGCIYNFKELRVELIKLGHKFSSTSDTAVIVEGLESFGISYLKRFNGMFAIAAWHKPSKTLYLVRDRFGVKPLYYFNNGRNLIFGSEIKAILKHPEYKLEVDSSALNEYFTFQNLFSQKTLFKNIYLLPPATTLTITRQGIVNAERWWDYDFSQPNNELSFNDAVSETKRLMYQAVERQMVADVPVGSYLSGGMDSGSITAIASKHISRLSTFTAGFELSEVHGIESTFDERTDAELVANYYKTEHYEQVINAGDLAWSLPKVVFHLEDLRVGMSYPNFYISRLASKFVKVCLQGTGGDEIYGGYPWRYYRVFKSLDSKTFFDNYYTFWQRLVPDDSKRQLFTQIQFNKIDIEEPRKIFEQVFLFNSKLKYDTPEEHVQNSLYFEIKTFLNGLLIVGDKLSMANGLEERFPFLDNDMVDFAQKIPVKHKLANFELMKRIDENDPGNKFKNYQQYDDGKNVLRAAMSSILPDRIVNRKKQGFSAPDESWYRGENAKYIKELLLGSKTISSDFINRDYIEHIVNQHIDERINHRLLIWSFMCFEWWCRIFLNGEKVY